MKKEEGNGRIGLYQEIFGLLGILGRLGNKIRDISSRKDNYCYSGLILVKFTFVKAITGIVTYIQEVRHELKQVVWPKKEVVIKLTLIVFIFPGIVGIYLGGLDLGFTKLLEYIISR